MTSNIEIESSMKKSSLRSNKARHMEPTFGVLEAIHENQHIKQQRFGLGLLKSFILTWVMKVNSKKSIKKRFLKTNYQNLCML